MKTNSKLKFLGIVSFSTILHSCFPVFSELQSARTVGKNRVEITPNATVATDGWGEQYEFGGQLAYGITSKFDMRFKYEYVEGVNAIAIAPKISLRENKIAFTVPIGTAFTYGFKETYGLNIHPTFLFTACPLKDKIDLTFSPKLLLSFSDSPTASLALNFSPAFSRNLKNWAIRPEIGALVGNGGLALQLSMGLSIAFGKRNVEIK